MTIATVRSYPQGPRLWVLGQRVHHGSVGCALIVSALSRRRLRALALLGGLLALHDRADWRVWFARESCDELVTLPGAAGCVTNRTLHEVDRATRRV